MLFLIKNFIDNNRSSSNVIDKENYSTITCDFAKGYKYSNYDDLIIVTSWSEGDKYNTVDASLDLGYTTTLLKGGKYKIVSHLGSIDVTIEPGKKYVITIDYNNNIFECHKEEE